MSPSATAVAVGGALEEDDYSGDEEEELRAKGQCGINVRYQGNADDANLVLASLTITFGKLLFRYAKARDIDPAGHKLLIDGANINAETSPKMLEWKAGRHYHIDCMATQIGGK